LFIVRWLLLSVPASSSRQPIFPNLLYLERAMQAIDEAARLQTCAFVEAKNKNLRD